jgi:hypothetical protein
MENFDKYKERNKVKNFLSKKQSGGYKMCSTDTRHILGTLLKFFNDVDMLDITDLLYINKDQLNRINGIFQKCYDFLINMYKTTIKYYQSFDIEKKTERSANHINYLALIFLNYLVEMHLFYLTHSNITDNPSKQEIGINTTDDNDRNQLMSIFNMYDYI